MWSSGEHHLRSMVVAACWAWSLASWSLLWPILSRDFGYNPMDPKLLNNMCNCIHRNIKTPLKLITGRLRVLCPQLILLSFLGVVSLVFDYFIINLLNHNLKEMSDFYELISSKLPSAITFVIFKLFHWPPSVFLSLTERYQQFSPHLVNYESFLQCVHLENSYCRKDRNTITQSSTSNS